MKKQAQDIEVGDIIRFPDGELRPVSASDYDQKKKHYRFYWKTDDGAGYPVNWFTVYYATNIEIADPDTRVEWKAEPAKLVPEPVIDDYEVTVVFNDGTKTALYFKELDFIKDLGWTNVDRINIKARWK